jgi:uncharacterized protein YcbX
MVAIASLHVYPIKSCRGIDVDEARVGPRGLEAHGVGDRQWAVVDESGRVVTQRECPSLARIVPRPEGGAMRVEAPGAGDLRIDLAGADSSRTATRITLWGESFRALDEGPQAASWFSDVVGFAARLVRFDEREMRPSSPERTRGLDALNRFSDGYPILLISSASLDDLNARWRAEGHRSLPMNRFRPNIVIEGIGPYAEDHMDRLQAGDIVLMPVKGCTRCSIPSVDQATGAVGPAPVETLARYRFDARLEGAVFGQNVVVARGFGAALRVGQALVETLNF